MVWAGAVIEEARRLGVRLSKADCDEALEKADPDELVLSEPEPEFALLPMVLEACRAPLPGGFTTPMHACGDALAARLHKAPGAVVHCG